MDFCYKVCGNYGLAIILFTFISKIVLIPVSIWVQKNSIKMVMMQPELYEIKTNHYGDKDTIADKQAELYKREKYNAFASVIPMAIQIALLIALISVIKSGLATGVENRFLGIELDRVPIETKGIYLIIPFIAGAAAYLLCFVQNRVNVLQVNSSLFEKYFTMAVSVALSLYLGFYVLVGVIIYWIFSNLFGILQIFFLNAILNPKKYIDYERLEKARKAFEEIDSIGKKKLVSKEDRKRERVDYKRFFSIGNKHLVFYSESNGFYKYFKGVIEYILENTNIVVHYITSDPKDNIFRLAEDNTQIKAYYIGEKKLITLMMKMDADVVVMTMPDLETYHIKRSYVRKDVEYIHIPHGMGSLNIMMRKGSLDHFDTVFCVGKHQKEEIEKTEEVYGLPRKTLVECGYSLLDDMRKSYKNSRNEHKERIILISPSWQKDNIIDSCLYAILDSLVGKGYRIIVRPHPQEVKHKAEQMEALKAKYAEFEDIVIQTDFSSNDTVFNADVMITDWSGIAFEFLFTTYRPVLFIDTPLKVMNPEYQKIDVEPFNIWVRDTMGKVLDPRDAGKAYEAVQKLMEESVSYRATIEQYMYEYVYNIDNSNKVAGDYIISAIQTKIDSRKMRKDA